jgi:hypothetical protein
VKPGQVVPGHAREQVVLEVIVQLQEDHDRVFAVPLDVGLALSVFRRNRPARELCRLGPAEAGGCRVVSPAGPTALIVRATPAPGTRPSHGLWGPRGTPDVSSPVPSRGRTATPE